MLGIKKCFQEEENKGNKSFIGKKSLDTFDKKEMRNPIQIEYVLDLDPMKMHIEMSMN